MNEKQGLFRSQQRRSFPRGAFSVIQQQKPDLPESCYDRRDYKMRACKLFGCLIDFEHAFQADVWLLEEDHLSIVRYC